LSAGVELISSRPRWCDFDILPTGDIKGWLFRGSTYATNLRTIPPQTKRKCFLENNNSKKLFINHKERKTEGVRVCRGRGGGVFLSLFLWLPLSLCEGVGIMKASYHKPPPSQRKRLEKATGSALLRGSRDCAKGCEKQVEKLSQKERGLLENLDIIEELAREILDEVATAKAEQPNKCSIRKNRIDDDVLSFFKNRKNRKKVPCR
jgi:hypothetical protein